MSNIDKQALREAAEKALPAMQRLLMMPNDELFDEALLNVDGDVDAANAFNLLAGPETMLALLDELEAAEHTAAVDHEAACSLVEENEEVKRKLVAAEKRIAELEARTVKLPEALIPAIHNSGEPFMRPEPFGLYLNRDDVLRALRAAGIGEGE